MRITVTSRALFSGDLFASSLSGVAGLNLRHAHESILRQWIVWDVDDFRNPILSIIRAKDKLTLPRDIRQIVSLFLIWEHEANVEFAGLLRFGCSIHRGLFG